MENGAINVMPVCVSSWASFRDKWRIVRPVKPAILFLLLSLPAFADLEAGRLALKNGDYATAIKELLPLANKGNASAQALLGDMYHDGKCLAGLQGVRAVVSLGGGTGARVCAGSPRRHVPRRRRCPTGLQGGHAMVPFGGGTGIRVCAVHSRLHVRKRPRGVAGLQGGREVVSPAAEQGNASARAGLGNMYHEGQGVPQDYKEAIRWERLAAQQGDAAGQYALANMFHTGQGIPQDYKEAVKWYRLAAEQGNASAQGALGFMYANEQGVLQDYKEAVKWYRLAAAQGAAYAQATLGILYAEGQGVPQDYVQAHMWFNLAGAGGEAAAIANRDVVARKMTPDQIAEAQRLAREWKPRSIQ